MFVYVRVVFFLLKFPVTKFINLNCYWKCHGADYMYVDVCFSEDDYFNVISYGFLYFYFCLNKAIPSNTLLLL